MGGGGGGGGGGKRGSWDTVAGTDAMMMCIPRMRGKWKLKTETESENRKAESWEHDDGQKFKPIVLGQCAYRCIVVSVSRVTIIDLYAYLA